MIPGFVTSYFDSDNYIHLYFYPGVTDDGKYIYRKIDLSSSGQKYAEEVHTDGSVDFKFYNKHIIRLRCKLIEDITGNSILENIETQHKNTKEIFNL